MNTLADHPDYRAAAKVALRQYLPLIQAVVKNPDGADYTQQVEAFLQARENVTDVFIAALRSHVDDALLVVEAQKAEIALRYDACNTVSMQYCIHRGVPDKAQLARALRKIDDFEAQVAQCERRKELAAPSEFASMEYLGRVLRGKSGPAK